MCPNNGFNYYVIATISPTPPPPPQNKKKEKNLQPGKSMMPDSPNASMVNKFSFGHTTNTIKF